MYVEHIGVNLWYQKKIGPIILATLTAHHTNSNIATPRNRV